MCNAYRLRTPISQLFGDLAAIGLPIARPAPGQLPNLEARETTRPTNTLPLFRPVDPEAPREGLELAEARWWLVPFFHKGPTVKDWKAMCTNAKAETAATSATFRGPFARRRCLVPADGFYEWTGEKGAKTKWLFEPAAGGWFSFAGLWDRWKGPDGDVDSFTIITTTPGPDAAPIHNRQPVILGPETWPTWLDLKADVSPLLGPSPAGTLLVSRAAEPAAAEA